MSIDDNLVNQVVLGRMLTSSCDACLLSTIPLIDWDIHARDQTSFRATLSREQNPVVNNPVVNKPSREQTKQNLVVNKAQRVLRNTTEAAWGSTV
jgi:hypothetical protein